jgi:predicted HAD superfamily Cof-like phosphohydrolase
MNMAQDVTDFHKKFGINYAGEVRPLPEDLITFRNKRAFDEVEEIVHAEATDDLPMVLDGIIDTIYILLGTAHLHGFTPEKINEAWRRVHVANMAKQLATSETGSPHGELGIRNGDIIKPPGWKAPDLSDLCS